ncbi:conserved Plasmodium protein, unknown function [Plasmodium berghei]|uniref:Uncharacterized protein n=2 Tax=Plasmodium berghei TaxID=5821 RepID=A0A509ASA2_PLABA|nr:conserved Plasmodium protein, unknown function [Plasmodium berghei ANKA]CXJ22843.1 conserved Plasmodium protein, unknown function [Plasmodium berghei]SCM26686.1 conserved Plasmodium protein, unknown function [Plasmodium berghei]SCN28585.1 conserved Plasmodium protein, unknown function [Plasmodium berghei]SCO62773.1 conserved Plasmodium protein, unknown function [Plasmodium berghei]SCO64333.1 conserved Plasmodium protein, unknown function [Plasmodium berghei]|eukprot:XP_034424229.1 conserved Plasmodium protein, unknown function [Plasmodium berghei ANKA]
MKYDDHNSDLNNSNFGSNDNDYSSDLENLPEYERELILAKRHEEYMKKKHRKILLKKINIDNKIEKNESDNKKTIQKKSKKKFTEECTKYNINNTPIESNKTKSDVAAKGVRNTKNDKEEADYSDNYDDPEVNIKRKTKKNQTSSLVSNKDKEKKKLRNLEKEEKKTDSKNKHKNWNDKNYNTSSYENSSIYSDKSYRKKKSKKDNNTPIVSENNKKRLARNKNYNISSQDENKNDKYIGDEKIKKLKLGKNYTISENKIKSDDKYGDNNKIINHKEEELLNKKKKKGWDTSEEFITLFNKKRDDRPHEYISSGKGIQIKSDTKYSNDQDKSIFNDLKKKKKNEIFEKSESPVKDPETPERLIQLYKEEKKIKLDIYKYMTYEIINYFQLKKTFLLDMSEHINFPYYVIGHVVKIDDLPKLIKTSDYAKNKNYSNNNITGIEKNKNIFFLKNVIKCDSYFCIDRYTNIKFEISHLDNLKNVNFFKKIKKLMNKNKKIGINELDNIEDNNIDSTYICDINNISDEKLTIDEYNHLKLFSINTEILKNFNIFLKEKIEDLKNFHYTEKQIQDLVEMKKQKSFYEIFQNNKTIDALPISRIVVQREICSILREIDTLNYSKKKINDVYMISKINRQIDDLTQKKDILRQQLEKTRNILTSMKSQDSISYETEKTIPQKKFTKSYYNSGLTDDYFKKIIGDEKKNIADMANHINDEKKNFNSYITNKIFDLPMDSHNKIMYHFLHGSLQSSEELFNDSLKIHDDEYDLFGVNIDKYVTSFDILKKNMNKQEENCKTN